MESNRTTERARQDAPGAERSAGPRRPPHRLALAALLLGAAVLSLGLVFSQALLMAVGLLLGGYALHLFLDPPRRRRRGHRKA